MRPRRLCFFSAVCLLLGAGFALARDVWAAAVLEIAPVVHELSGERRLASMTVTNRGGSPTWVQLRAFDWRQPGDGDELQPTGQVAISPPMFELRPGEAQIVRILVRPEATADERAFRLLLDEIPPPESVQGVRFVLQVSLPIFLAPTGPQPPPPATPPLAMEVQIGQRILKIRNLSKTHVRLSQLALWAPDGGQLELQTLPSPYLLAGAQRRIAIKGDGALNLQPGAKLVLSMWTVAGRLDVPVVAVP